MITLRLPAVLVLGLVSLVLAGCGATFGTTTGGTQEMPADGVTVLEVDNDNGEVRVEASQTDDNMISVNYQLRNSGDIDFSVTREGDRVIVRAKDNSSFLESAVANLTIRLPAQIVVNVTTGNGRVEVENMHGYIDASTGNGSIELSGNGDPTEAADISTGNGSITVESHTGNLVANSGNGSIEISGHTGRIRANTGNGRVEYEGMIAAAAGNTLTAGNGSIAATVHNPSVSFIAESDSGRVTINGEYTSKGGSSDERAEGVFGDEPSAALLELRSGRGDVTLTHESGG